MNKAIILASIFTALTGAAALADNGAGQDPDCSYLNQPIRSLNAHTGKYESIRTRTDRGWCQWSDSTIGDGSWDADGGEASASDSSSSGESGGSGEGPY